MSRSNLSLHLEQIVRQNAALRVHCLVRGGMHWAKALIIVSAQVYPGWFPYGADLAALDAALGLPKRV